MITLHNIHPTLKVCLLLIQSQTTHQLKAQRDVLNPGILDNKGIWKPPPYSVQVHSFMFADIKENIKKQQD